MLITALAAALHDADPAPRKHFPDLYGQHRLAYTRWLLEEDRFAYQLDSVLLAPIVRSWAEALPSTTER